MRKPVGRTRTLRQTSKRASLPAPVSGWNKRDAEALMKPTDAIIMDNWFPDTDVVRLRNGYDGYVTGIAAATTSLMEWAGPSTQKLIAGANNAFYDVSTAGAVGAAQQSGHTNSKWQHTMFATAGGNFLYCVNGQDSARYYDGTTWTTPSITGATSSTFILIMAHQGRLWFGQTATLDVWYLAPTSISGAATKLPLGSIAKRGGHLVGMASWTIDGGNGMEDLAVFVTSEGEVMVYQGTDPASSTTWALKGVYQIGRPIGNRCVIKYGGDLVVMTEDGFLPLSKAIVVGLINPNVALSDAISKAVKDASATSRLIFGWQACLHSRGRMIIFNVPRNGLTSYQFVMNTITGAWCRFVDINAFCWATFQGNLFFGGATAVYQADTGTNDDGIAISSDILTAYNYFGTPGSEKRFVMVKPRFLTPGNVIPAVAICTNFQRVFPDSTPSYSGSSGSPWDTSPWDTSPWGGDDQLIDEWLDVAGVGSNAALRMRTQSLNFGLSIATIDYMYESGGIL